MRRAEIPEDVRRFILTSVPSVPYLEAILLLKADPGAGWDVPRLAAAGIARGEDQVEGGT